MGTLCAGLAAALSFVVLLGWTFGLLDLTTFWTGLPTWPISAIGYLTAAAALLPSRRMPNQAAAALAVIPLAISVAALADRAFGFGLSLGTLLFPEQVARFAPLASTFADPTVLGRPGIGSAAAMLLLACGTLFGSLGVRGGRTSTLFGLAALGTTGTSLVMILLSPPLDRATGGVTSIPSAVIGSLLGVALILKFDSASWSSLARPGRGWQMIVAVLPAMLVLPAGPSLTELWVADHTAMPMFEREMLVVLCNALIVAMLIYWTVSRLAHDQNQMRELTEALGTTTTALASLDGCITYWSPGCEDLYGFPAAEALGKRKYELLRSRSSQREAAGLPTRTSDHAQELVETRRDGREVAVLERTREIHLPHRDPMLVFSMSDITQRTEALMALRESERQLEMALAAHELGVFEWDVKSGRITMSPGMEQRLGLAPGSISSLEGWRDHVVPEDGQAALETIAQAVAAKADRLSFRYRLRQASGGIRVVEGSAHTYYDADGNLVRTLGVMHDVSEREQRDAELRSREAQLSSILETVPDAMVVVDQEGTVREFSRAAEQLWGYRSAEVLGQSFTMLVPPDERARYLDALRGFNEGGQGGFTFVGAVVPGMAETIDGRRFPVEIRTGMARTDHTTLFTLIFRDVTERLSTEERLSDLNAELAHVSRQNAMSELAADLAHELNQPLAAASNFLAAARMLLEQGQGDRATEMLRMGGEQTLRAGEIIRRLRDFMSRREVEMRVESIERTIQDSVELVLVGTGQFDIRLVYELDPEVPLMFADRVQVQQVLVNLLRNAIDALRAVPRGERTITLSTRRVADEMVEITVRDTGPGIPESLLKQLYTRFVSTKERAGMGIGLSISRRIIEAHGGTLIAENIPEGGACFRFTLPVVEEREEQEA